MPVSFLSRTNQVLKKIKSLPYQTCPLGSHATSPVGVNTENASFLSGAEAYRDPRNAPSSHTCQEDEVSTSQRGSARINPFGIQMLSRDLRHQVFGDISEPTIPINTYRSAMSLFQKHNLDTGKVATMSDVDLKIPPLKGDDIIQHFRVIGAEQSAPYVSLIQDLCHELPPTPKKWLMKEGWTCYSSTKRPEAVAYPPDDALIFDVEVCNSAGQNPTLAVAVSRSAWYAWVSPSLISKRAQGKTERLSTDNLISLESETGQNGAKFGSDFKRPRIVVGHNVAYDRSRVKEQYWLERSGTRFLDTMSLHISVSGVTSHQKAMLLKSKRMRTEHENAAEEDTAYEGDSDVVLSLKECSSLNSLTEVHALYCGSQLEKATRDIFVEGRLEDVREKFQECMDYCASDVAGTHRVLCSLFPLFLERFPHPVTLAGMLEISMAYLPVNKNWERYLEDSDGTFNELDTEAKFLLSKRADDACAMLNEGAYKKDLWMWSEDWSVNNLKLNKSVAKKPKIEKVPVESLPTPHLILSELREREYLDEDSVKPSQEIQDLVSTSVRLPARRPHLPGYPAWYRKLCEQPSADNWSPGPQLITTKMQVTPKLLKLTWESYPLHHIRNHGWGCLRPADPKSKSLPELEPTDLPFPTDEMVAYWNAIPQDNIKLGGDLLVNKICAFKKLPHKDGKDLRVGDPLARDFLSKLTENILAGDEVAEQLLTIARKLTYWRNNRDRIMDQIVMWLKPEELPPDLADSQLGAILPQVIVCGTLTRRAVERTWMTASNISQERVGSEIRSVVQSPPGFCFVGADVDSQELWIASLIGDAKSVRMHGGTPIGWMTLSGTKADKTDMHSVTARAVGISRDHAKVINYARIYGAGQAFAQQLIKQFNPQISDKAARDKAKTMMTMTKGSRFYRLRPEYSHVATPGVYTAHRAYYDASCQGVDVNRMFDPVWSGGMESAMFNQLEKIANSAEPRTPFLEGRISRALEKDRGNNQTTRVNWVVQSGAVDFLHLLLVAFRWLEPEARFCLSFHDEVRYLVPDKRRYKATLALHVAHLLTRSFCAAKLGLVDLPLSVAFFSSVEVDRSLRKDATSECTTPSNPHGLSKGHGIPPGESLDIYQAIRMAGSGTVALQDTPLPLTQDNRRDVAINQT